MRFTTNAYPREQRQDAWRFSLTRVSLELLATPDDIYGELVSFSSGQGIQFVRVTGNGQRLAIDFNQEAPCFWMVLLLEGRLTARQAELTIEIAEGDILYGGGSSRTEIELAGEHRFLLVKVPHMLPALRSRSALPSRISNLIADEAIGRMLSALLRSVADTIVDVSDDQIRPVELALPEFIAATLLDKAPVKELGGAAGARAAILERVFQSIEMRLSDPNLSIHQIAAEHRISSRYLQKLFESAGESFSQFVKFRRLERCRLDLGSPLHAQRSISEILFQWGFNDSASFSRAFRERYAMSPREYRKIGALPEETLDMPQRGRPSAGKDSRGDSSADGAADGREEAATVPHPSDGLVDDVQVDAAPGVRHHVLPVRPDTIHWGYFSKNLKPALEICSGDYVTIETLTHHANDDAERMIEGDPAAEAIYRWTAEGKVVDRRGAGPLDASVVGRGPGEGFGVHICTGPIHVAGAQPGDVIQVRILDIANRPSRNPRYAGRSFGSNVSAYWGFHYSDLLTEPKQREVVTIYEVEGGPGQSVAHAVYNYRWTPQKDPSGVIHPMYDYPGVPVDPETIEKNFNVLRDIEIPVRPHFGVVALAPAHSDLVDSVPPANFGGNIDNWRLGAGASVYLPVAVPGGLLSLGDPHASQGDSELCGTAIECSMTAVIQVILHPAKGSQPHIRELDYPMIETATEWVILGFSNPDYLRELGAKAQSEVYKRSSIDSAMRDCFRKARRFLMTVRNLSEDEAISLLSVGVDFGISQVANGNWGVHAVIRKAMFSN
ncbi:acetamidase/formamidase family protein [Novosphingobium sp. KCTC 2891]|uniref:acetamidase/formamidase family protein n=1 Tax=Novosphingobium sp. KCTC 2891 TaxID=2989730 RepID=UPI0022224F2E|nr:acetamidase/formamidase family protein [Novosphingobium sp. KCTC 2891]